MVTMDLNLPKDSYLTGSVSFLGRLSAAGRGCPYILGTRR